MTCWKVILKLTLIHKMTLMRKRDRTQYEADSILGERRSFHTKSQKNLVRFNISERKIYMPKHNENKATSRWRCFDIFFLTL